MAHAMGDPLQKLTDLMAYEAGQRAREMEVEAVRHVVEPLLERCRHEANKEVAREIARIAISTRDMHRDITGRGPPA